MEILDQKIHEAKDQLIERFEHICKQPISAAKFMWENNMMAGFDGVTTRSALKHGTLAIGQLGLAEALQILVGCDHTEAKGMELAKRIEALFQKRCKEFKTEEHTAPEDGSKYYLNFGVYYSPAESLCYTAMQKFKEKYGVIPNVSENEFFTNSMHVPVWKEISVFEKIDIEAQLTNYSSAGCITYVELDSSATNNIDALEAIVNYAMDKDIPYFAINIPNDQCKDCGFTGDFNDCCPACGSKDIKQLRRVTGYLSGDYRKFFNLGKQQEVQMRFKHSTKK
jgi:ribonucleoside-triphosphate reductase